MTKQEITAVRNTAFESGDFDVVIIGAGVSGIGMAAYLRRECPWARFIIFEALDSFGGTWWTHRYPGVRSDTDMFSYAYKFKPWTGEVFGAGPDILQYLGEVIEEQELASSIHYGHRVQSASWSSDAARWTLSVETGGEKLAVRASFLWTCSGYFGQETPYIPDWPGKERFRGKIVHPQHWPADLDVTDQQVVIIGSGATAATLIPSIADNAKHVTMLQRSPTYFYCPPRKTELETTLEALGIDPLWTSEILRRKFLQDLTAIGARCAAEPDAVAADLIAGVEAIVGDKVDVARHFTPRYTPFRQRIALLPDGDMLHSIASGKASVETDEIECFTETGLVLRSGKTLDTDIIVSATGFNICVLGDIEFQVDGKRVDWSDTVTYRGMMFTGVPNLLWLWGYARFAWTLRVDLIAELACRLLNHMRERKADIVVPMLPQGEEAVGYWFDPEDFNPGYLMRSRDILPRSGRAMEWQHPQNYWTDLDEMPNLDFETAPFDFSSAKQEMAPA